MCAGLPSHAPVASRNLPPTQKQDRPQVTIRVSVFVERCVMQRRGEKEGYSFLSLAHRNNFLFSFPSVFGVCTLLPGLLCLPPSRCWAVCQGSEARGVPTKCVCASSSLFIATHLIWCDASPRSLSFAIEHPSGVESE